MNSDSVLTSWNDLMNRHHFVQSRPEPGKLRFQSDVCGIDLMMDVDERPCIVGFFHPVRNPEQKTEYIIENLTRGENNRILLAKSKTDQWNVLTQIVAENYAPLLKGDWAYVDKIKAQRAALKKFKDFLKKYHFAFTHDEKSRYVRLLSEKCAIDFDIDPRDNLQFVGLFNPTTNQSDKNPQYTIRTLPGNPYRTIHLQASHREQWIVYIDILETHYPHLLQGDFSHFKEVNNSQ